MKLLKQKALFSYKNINEKISDKRQTNHQFHKRFRLKKNRNMNFK
jgi:hypothetical protein